MNEMPQWLRPYLTPPTHEAITRHVAAAERMTSGEIVPMVVRRSATFGHVPLVTIALLMNVLLILDMIALDFGFGLPAWLITLAGVATIPLGLLLSRWSSWQRLMSHRGDLRTQVERRAQLEFHALKVAATEQRTGILLFVSLAEHQAVVLADLGIAAKLPAETWSQVLKALTHGSKSGAMGRGFCEAIDQCGTILADHFPAPARNDNELRDALIIRD
jgi:putative membrane protein